MELLAGTDGEEASGVGWPAAEAAFGAVWAELPGGRSQGLDADEALQQARALCFLSYRSQLAHAASGTAACRAACNTWVERFLMHK